MENNDLFSFFIESYYNSSLLTPGEKRSLNLYLKKSNLNLNQLNENFYDKLKARYDKAKQVAVDMSDKAKEALQKIVTAAKDAVNFVGKIKEQLLEWCNKIISTTKDKIKGKLQADGKFMKAVKDKLSHDKNAFIKDLKTCTEVVNFYKNSLVNNIVKSFTTNLSGFLSKEDTGLTLQEKLLLIQEGNNMIDKLVGGIAHIPPFSWLHDLAHLGEKGANKAIGLLSNITNKLGGPAFTLPVIGAILGIAFEYNIKGLAKHGLLEVVEFFTIPFVGIIIKSIGYAATFIAVYEIINHLAGTNKSHGEEQEHTGHENKTSNEVPI